MNKLTILLIVVIIMAVGVAGYIFGSQNNQGVPITFTNNSTDNDSGFSSESTKSTIKPKTNTTIKKNTTTNSTPKTNNTTST